MPRTSRFFALAAPICLVACSPKAAPVSPPAQAEAIAQAPEPEPEPEPPKVPEDAFSIGTFNLHWAHDAMGERAPKLAKQNRAKSDEEWEWKVAAVAKVLTDEKLDIVAVQEVGGEAELLDITVAVRDMGGPDYDFAWIESKDPSTGHQVAILSTFDIVDQRRLEVHMRKHIAADIRLPSDDVITVIGVHARGGKYKAHRVARRKQAKAVKRLANKMRKKNPVILLGTTNTLALPDEDEYRMSDAGVWSGEVSRSPSDDCKDSASYYRGQQTTVAGDTLDRIFACGIEMRDAETTAEDRIVRETPDPDDTRWGDVPVDENPYRDVSDHLVLWAEVALPQPPPEQSDEEDTDEDS